MTRRGSHQSDQTTAEILIVGNELLNGTTLDTNSYWLSSELTKLGIKVSRKTTVRDVLPVISKSFRECITRKPNWLFSLGGLGPTYDDMTIQGLAIGLDRNLVLDEGAVKMLKERYKLRAKLIGRNPGRIPNSSLKMARIPTGAIPLKNPVGSAPGVLATYGRTRIISLPGVPAEMKAIFKNSVIPLLKRGQKFSREEEWLKISGISESRLAPTLNRIAQRSAPMIYIKSHPRGFEHGHSVLHIQMILTSSVEQKREFTRKLLSVAKEVAKAGRRLGAKVSHLKSVR